MCGVGGRGCVGFSVLHGNLYFVRQFRILVLIIYGEIFDICINHVLFYCGSTWKMHLFAYCITTVTSHESCGVSNHRQLDFVQLLILVKTKKSRLCTASRLWGKSAGDRWIPLQRASNTESVSVITSSWIVITSPLIAPHFVMRISQWMCVQIKKYCCQMYELKFICWWLRNLSNVVLAHPFVRGKRKSCREH